MKTGKRKAEAVLHAEGLDTAWVLWSITPAPCTAHREPQTEDCQQCRLLFGKEEVTIRDIVSRLVKYGSLSEKQTAYLNTLITTIADRPVAALRKALWLVEKRQRQEKAEDCPAGRVEIEGAVLSEKWKTGYYGSVLKVLIESDRGFRVWGSQFDGCHKGDRVKLGSTVTISRDDPKFGFFSRPKGTVTMRASAEEVR